MQEKSDISHENILCGPKLDLQVPEVAIGQWMYESLQALPLDFILLTEAETEKKMCVGELLENCVNVATSLRELGVTNRDAVAIIGENSIDLCISGIATMFLGAIMSPIDPTLKSHEFQHILKIIQAKVVFCDKVILPEVRDALDKLTLEPKLIEVGGDSNEKNGILPFESLRLKKSGKKFFPEPSANPREEVAVIVCSSGTTGMPKGVAISHYALAFQIKALESVWPAGTLMHTALFYWISGVLILIGSTIAGVPRVLVRAAEPSIVLETISKYKPFMGFMTPSLLSAVLQHRRLKEFDLTSLKVVTVGGAAVNQTLAENFHQTELPHGTLSQGYGCSELSGIVSQTKPDMDVLSLGAVICNTQVKIISTDKGDILGPDQEGEILCKSPSMMKGYVGNKKATEEAIDAEGWYHTGDIGKYTSAGVLYITGRAKELMKIDGHQISPEEIEAVVANVSGVLDVVVTGIPVDENDWPMALVIKQQGSDVSESTILRAVKDHLSEFKQLRAGVYFVDSILRTSTGKVKRREVRAIAEVLYLRR